MTVSPILTEHSRWERQAVDESSPMVCKCGGIYTLVSVSGGGPLDDEECRSVICMRCDEGFTVRTWRSSARVDVSPMSKSQRALYPNFTRKKQ